MNWLLLAVLATPIDDVRASWSQTQALVDGGHTAVIRVDLNATDASWPAVGNYTNRVDIHRVQGDESHYPDTVLKIVHTQVSAASWSVRYEYLFSPQGALQFAFLHDEMQPDARVYYQGDTVLRVKVGDRIADAPTGDDLALATRTREHALALYALAQTLQNLPSPDLLTSE